MEPWSSLLSIRTLADSSTEWTFDGNIGIALDASSPLRIVSDAALGRHAVAARAVTAGELVFSDEPFAQTVHENFADIVCHCCYAPLPQTSRSRQIGCNACRGVLYCSKECAASFAATHAGECALLCDVGVSSVGNNLRLYLRMAHRGKADPSDLAEVERMHEHYDDCGKERQRTLDAQAEAVNRFLPESARLDRTRVARLIDRVHTNAFAVVGDPAGSACGTALYARAGSLFNHSCSPSYAPARLQLMRHTRQWGCD